ncbi:hypothetical protein [Sphingobacterium sp. BIGb0165]|uniref:hypothetical protein n=1 Tax=Sphingobacterium sp. BIGb0165 TaxID=2940615 RepID=UPI00216772CB|nr:hypothetical protein [Sphingobacterium sp. BIGb0165]MCS4227073.1 hypothetical protein [Sphingobacterium sp. BIGb0165]
MMKTTLKWLLYTIVVFFALCALSYHNDTDNDGSLNFGFPLVIYHKAVYVFLVATNTIGQSEEYHPLHLFIDAVFAVAVSLVFITVGSWLKKRKYNNRDGITRMF